MAIGVPELIIILVIVALVFGPRRLGEVAGELGKGIRNFRDGLTGKDDQPSQPAAKPQASEEPPK